MEKLSTRKLQGIQLRTQCKRNHLKRSYRLFVMNFQSLNSASTYAVTIDSVVAHTEPIQLTWIFRFKSNGSRATAYCIDYSSCKTKGEAHGGRGAARWRQDGSPPMVLGVSGRYTTVVRPLWQTAPVLVWSWQRLFLLRRAATISWSFLSSAQLRRQSPGFLVVCRWGKKDESEVVDQGKNIGAGERVSEGLWRRRH
jgi:hypothetical protein